MLTTKLLQEFGRIMGLKINGKVNSEEGFGYGSLDGDKALFMSSLARVRCVDLKQQWKTNTEDMGYYAVDRVARGLEKFKKARGLYDFTDLLEAYVVNGFVPKLDLLVVDEAQDLSQLQWRMVNRLMTRAERVLIAGDDDQAIFQWAGADVPHFINLKGSVTVLNKSYRLPKAVFDKASNIVDNIGIRRAKHWSPREEEGNITYRHNPNDINMAEGSWLILARNAYMLDEVKDKCHREGWLYEHSGRKSVSNKSLTAIKNWEFLRNGGELPAKEVHPLLGYLVRSNKGVPQEGSVTMVDLRTHWGVTTEDIWHKAFVRMMLEERTYLIAALKRGEKPTAKPRIQLSTIHGSKGGEADNVILYSDMARRTYEDMRKVPDNERRVFYVGATRARHNLHVMLPNSDYFFPEL